MAEYNTEFNKEFQPYMSYEVRAAYQAGYDQFFEWTSGETVHSGIGWFHPFGKSHYYAVVGDCEEKKAFPLEKYFSDYWMDLYDTALFCICRLDDGDIYIYDGVFCVRGEGGDHEIPFDDTVHIRKDIITNVVVGGTGRYEGAVGLLLGTTEGSGKIKTLDNGLTLPEGLLKCLNGYIKIPIKE